MQNNGKMKELLPLREMAGNFGLVSERKSPGRSITGDVFYALPYGVVPSGAKNVVEHQPTRIMNDNEYRDRYKVFAK